MSFPSNYHMRIVLTFAGVLLGALLVCGEEPAPFQITAELGFGNFFKSDLPLPFRLDISAVKKKVEGRIRVFCPNSNGGATIYEFPASLAPESHKQWQLTLPPIAGTSVRVQVVDHKGVEVNAQDFFGILVGPESQFVVVVQENNERRFAFPRTARDPSLGEWRTGGIEPSGLPENPLAYAPVSAILWRSENPQALNPAQARALLNWVKLGGVLILAGGRAIPPNLPPDFQGPIACDAMTSFALEDLRDAALQPPTRPLTMLAVHPKIPAWQPPAPANVTVAVKPLQAAASQSRLQVGEIHLMGEQPVGGGVLMQLAFDPADLQNEGGTLDWVFWNEALRLPDPRLSLWTTTRWLIGTGADEGRTALAQAADFRIAGPGYISAIYGTFFTLGFGLNFWIFRKSRRYEWAWCILLAAAVATFLFNRAYGRTGGLGRTRHVEVSQTCLMANEKSLVSFTELGLLSAGSGRATVETTSPHQLLFSTDRQMRVIELLPDQQVFRTRLQPGAFSTCSSIALADAPGKGMRADWIFAGANLEIALTDQTGLGVRQPRVVHQNSTSWRGNTLQVSRASLDESIQGILTRLSGDPRNQPVTWYGNNPRLYAEGDGAYVSRLPLFFTFEMPRKASPLIRSEFPNQRLQNHVVLVAPVPLPMDSLKRVAPSPRTSAEPRATASGPVAKLASIQASDPSDSHWSQPTTAAPFGNGTVPSSAFSTPSSP